MTWSGSGSHGRLWLTVALVALLGLIPLAWLQYRWIEQISAAEQERMRAHLDAAVARFSFDFDSEIGRLFRGLMLGPRGGAPEQELEQLAGRYRRLAESGAEAKLLRAIFVSRSDRAEAPELFKLNFATGEFQKIAWPAELERLRSGIESGRPQSPIDDDLPALIMPRMRQGPPDRRRSDFPQREFPRPDFPPQMDAQRRPPPSSGYHIAQLDLDYIRKEIFPELVRRHFPSSGELDCQVQIVSVRNPSEVLYSSDPALPPEFFATFDASRNLLAQGPPPGGGFSDRGFFRQPPGGVEPRGGWRLLVKHRAGSLENVVARTRRNNLAVSFAILLILAAGFAVLLFATRRSQQFARRQLEFVAGVSHELRTPLTVICSAGENLADGLVTNAQQVKKYGSVIRGEGRRLTLMVEQILGYAGIQSGRARYEMQPTSVQQAVQRTLSDCAMEIDASGCTVETEFPADLPLISADGASLAQCLRNLISNALAHGAHGGWIGIRARRIATGNGYGVEISVEDRGLGVDPADLPHLFEPFYRGRRSVEEQTRGFGLGLALVKRIVEAHSGSISVSSAEGKGTIFTLQLPAIEDSIAENKTSVPTNPAS